MTDAPGTDEMVTCTFDVVAVATFHVRHPGGPAAARAAINSLNDFSPAHGVDDAGRMPTTPNSSWPVSLRASGLSWSKPTPNCPGRRPGPVRPAPGTTDRRRAPACPPRQACRRCRRAGERLLRARLRALCNLAAAVGAALGSGEP